MAPVMDVMTCVRHAGGGAMGLGQKSRVGAGPGLGRGVRAEN